MSPPNPSSPDDPNLRVAGPNVASQDIEALEDDLRRLARVPGLWSNPDGLRDCPALLGLLAVEIALPSTSRGSEHLSRVAALRTVMEWAVDRLPREETRREATIYFGLEERWRSAGLKDRRDAIEIRPSGTWRRGGEQRLRMVVAHALLHADREIRYALDLKAAKEDWEYSHSIHAFLTRHRRKP